MIGDELCVIATPVTFEAGVDRYSFAFQHRLQFDPIFSLDSLRALAQRRGDSPHLAYWSNGRVDVDQTWRAGTVSRTSLKATLTHIETNDSLVLLKHIEADAAFTKTMQLIIAAILRLAGPRFSGDVEQARGTVLIASPGRTTSYHIDADANFLLQIAGDKTLFVFDKADRDLLSDQQLEAFFGGDINAALYQPALQHEAMEYRLKPGAAVHIPSTAPHWAQSTQSVSVGLSVNFDLRSVRRLGSVYRVNRRLRVMGLSPRGPNESAWRDDLKLGTAVSLRSLRRLVSPTAPRSTSTRPNG